MQDSASFSALGPLDGRYVQKVAALQEYFSEQALMRYRIFVEVEYLIELLRQIGRPASYEESALCRALYETVDFPAIKEYERKTKHDVKAVEYYIADRLRCTLLADRTQWIHFGLTSEDVNNLAYSLMLSDGISNCIIPELQEIYISLTEFSNRHKSLVMLARTHGQPATPTTFGKEFAVFAHRLGRQLDMLGGFKIQAKLAGASGNWNAHIIAFPSIDWKLFSACFVGGHLSGSRRHLRLEFSPIVSQIEPHDTYAELFDIFRRINMILVDFCQDVWRYISDDWLVQKPVDGATGSSTMPHKVNPIDFENAEGNLAFAGAQFEFFARKLPVSRLQRDLSDSTVERNFGVAFGHSLLAYRSILAGLKKIAPNPEVIQEYIDRHQEVIAEAVQTILRREGVQDAYERMKEMTRGREFVRAEFLAFIFSLPVSDEVKEELRGLTVEKYIGLSDRFSLL